MKSHPTWESESHDMLKEILEKARSRKNNRQQNIKKKRILNIDTIR